MRVPAENAVYGSMTAFGVCARSRYRPIGLAAGAAVEVA
jgi:hypothetical protein